MGAKNWLILAQPALTSSSSSSGLETHTHTQFQNYYKVTTATERAHHSQSTALCSRSWAHVDQLNRTIPGNPNTGSRFRASQSLVWGSGMDIQQTLYVYTFVASLLATTRVETCDIQKLSTALFAPCNYYVHVHMCVHVQCCVQLHYKVCTCI